MKITLTIREALHMCNDWDDLCEEIGLNPWCLNEGLASGDEFIEIEYDIAERYGLI